MLALTLKNVTDAELEKLRASLGGTQGKPAIYRQPIADMLAQSNGNNVTGTVEWNEVNPAADTAKSVKDGDKSPRDVVIAGLRTSANAKKSPAKGRITFHATPGSETAITVIVAKKAA